ncbi:phospholipase D family protein, partial [Burkholderia multivorans]|nr:phospholipase D family protein [Burkholderia multivorans]
MPDALCAIPNVAVATRLRYTHGPLSRNCPLSPMLSRNRLAATCLA